MVLQSRAHLTGLDRCSSAKEAVERSVYMRAQCSYTCSDHLWVPEANCICVKKNVQEAELKNHL